MANDEFKQYDGEAAGDEGASGFALPRWARRRLTWALLGFTALTLVLALVVKRSAHSAGKGGKAVVVTAQVEDLDVTVLVTGRVQPRLQTQIKSKVAGQVSDVLVEEGQKVKAGDTLLKIDPNECQREVARARADVQQQEAAVIYSRRQLARARRARSLTIAPAEELDRFEYEAALNGGKLRSSRVALWTARDCLKNTEVPAPFEGTVVQRAIQPGEMVVQGMTATVEGKPLLVLADVDTLLVAVELNQIDVAKVSRGQRAHVTLDALPGRTYTASVTRVSASAGASARAAAGQATGPDVFPVEMRLDPDQDLSEIKLGMTADVSILVARRTGVVALPIEAVVEDKGRKLVNVLEARAKREARFVEREVSLGVRNDRDVEILKGIAAGDRILVAPLRSREQM